MPKRGDTYGKWTLLSLIREGGQGAVWRAAGDEGEAEVALKIVSPHQMKDRKRFVRETEVQVRLTRESAPNIMPVIDSRIEEAEDESVTGYIVMPLAALSLQKAVRTTTGRVELALEVFDGILTGVRAAHQAGVVHRDLKPANILFVDDSLREPLVADFGICLLKETPDEDRDTEVGETVGAQFFMAPEQQRGGITKITETADIYALAKLLHHILTGRYIHREEVGDAFTQKELDSDPRFQLILDGILRKCVLNEPGDRIASVTDLQAVVRRIRGGPDEPPSNGEKGPPSPETPLTGPAPELINRPYRGFIEQTATPSSPVVLLALDDMRRDFRRKWTDLRSSIENTPERSAEAARQLILSQAGPVGLALAVGRANSTGLFPAFKHIAEMTLRDDDPRSGYPAVFGVPHLLGGFMYMAANVQAIAYQSWDILTLLLNDKFEWYYRTERPLFAFGFNVPYFFHSEALERKADKIHNFYRELLNSGWLSDVLTISGERLLDTYLQAQMLMCLRVAQEAEKGDNISIWPDYGRFYGQRISQFLERAHSVPSMGAGLAHAFNETPDVFFKQLPTRLRFVSANFWSGSPYPWESLLTWHPRS